MDEIERDREMLRDAPTLQLSPHGDAYALGSSRFVDEDPTITRKMLELVVALGPRQFSLAQHGYQMTGRGAVSIVLQSASWLEQAPPGLPMSYLSEQALTDMLEFGERSRGEVLRKIESYDPAREIVAVVSMPGFVFSTVLQPFDMPG